MADINGIPEGLIKKDVKSRKKKAPEKDKVENENLKQSTELQKEVIKTIKDCNASYRIFEQEIKEMQRRNVPETEILAVANRYQKSVDGFNSKIEGLITAVEDQTDLEKNTQYQLISQLQRIRKQLPKEDEKAEVLNALRGQIKDIFIESKASRIAELEQLKIDKEREKRDRTATNKAGWISAFLTPVRSLTDAFFNFTKGKSTEEYLTERFVNAEKDRQKEEDKGREQRSKIIDLIKAANENLTELGSKERITAADLNLKDLHSLGLFESKQKLKNDEQIALGVMDQLSSIDLTKLERDEAKATADRANKNRLFSGAASLLGPAGDMMIAAREQRQIEGDINEHRQYIGVNESVMREVSPSVVSNGSSEVDPMLEKIAPDPGVLLAKGGVVGASVVFLAKKLGLITDSLGKKVKNKSNDESADGLFKNISSMVKPFLPAIIGNATAIAIPLALGAGAAAMQKRDTADAKKYFEKGDKARGVETFLLGDRERVTEETANRELGRSTGKAALAGGAVAGGVAAGGFIASGGAAAAGAAATAAGAGLGGAALASAGAALAAVVPPVLIGAAIAATAMVVAKGTQEAFELGWDKNQAAIQKELTETMLSDDATMIQKIKAGAASTWKGFTGSLAGGIREAGKVLDAETMIQNEKQINFIKERAEAGSEGHQRLFEMMESEQFKVMSEAEKKVAMQAEGLYDEFQEAQEATRKSLGEHLLTAGKTVGGFFNGLVDTTMEGMRGRETAVWEKAALKGMENMTGEDVDRLKQSDAYRESMENGGDHKKAMQAAYLSEEREKAIARGDLREDGMAIQEGNWLGGMMAGAAAGTALGPVGQITGGLAGALGGTFLGKYMGLGDTGMSYKKKQSDEEYRQTFEYSKKKLELMNQGMTAEEADLAAIEEQNALYDQAVTLRLKQSKEYKQAFDQKLQEGKSLKEAEEEALEVAKANRENTMTTSELIKISLTKSVAAVKKFVKDPKKGIGNLINIVTQRVKELWNSISEWFSGIFHKMGDAVKGILGGIANGWNSLKDKATGAKDWISDVLSGEVPDGVNGELDDGIVTKDGKVIKLSPDDNVYATKNEPKVIRDQEAQRAMPDAQKHPAEFTDTGIIAAVQILTDVLRNKNMSTTVVSPVQSVNFDQFRMADALA